MDALTLYRISNKFHRKGWRRLSKLLTKLNYLVFGCYIPGSATIGAGTRIAYGGMAVVIHADAVIRRECLIGQCVTLGAKKAEVSNETHPCPTVGDNVYIAAGAKLLGGISIGSYSIIGANSVVLESFPSYSIIAGLPARRIRDNDSDYRVMT